MATSVLLALATGIGLAAASGLRAFLPLLAVGLAARFGLLSLPHPMDWLAGDPVLWTLGVASAVEVIGDKVPVVDHALDVLGTVLRPAAAAIATFAVFATWGTPWAQLVALVMGAGAIAVHGAKAHARLGSTALTLGHLNPVLSVAEDLATLALVAAALLLPLVALAFVLVGVWLLTRLRGRR